MRRQTKATVTALLLGLLAADLAGRPGSARQDRPQLPAFRSRITLVPVDVRVVDRNGKPVTDLTQKDFTVLEDGVPQQIRHFSTHRFIAASAPDPQARPPLRRATGPAVAPQDGRVFLIVLGRGRLQEPSKGFDGLLEFVREHLLPQDQVAVIGYNRATDFTADHERVAQALEQYKSRYEHIEALFRQWEDPVGGINLTAQYGSLVPAWIQAEIDKLFDVPGTVTSRQLTPSQPPDARRIADDVRRTSDTLRQAELVSERGVASGADRAALQDAERIASVLPLGEFLASARRTRQDLERIYSGIEYLRYLDGEKHLIFVSEDGITLPRLDHERGIAAVASDSRVVIDTIHTGGVPIAPAWGGPRGNIGVGSPMALWPSMEPLRALKHLSELTGGQSSLTEYTRAAVARIDETTRFQYLVGYYPSNPARDGHYRRIQVKVNRPGVTVLFRHGYYASDMLVPLHTRDFQTYRRIVVAANYDRDVGDIRLTMKASAVKREKGPGRDAFVELTIDPSRVSFTEVDERHVAALDISVFCADAREQPVGELWNKMDLALTRETYGRLMREGIPYTARVPLTGDLRYVKVIVYDYAGDLLGSVTTRVR